MRLPALAQVLLLPVMGMIAMVGRPPLTHPTPPASQPTHPGGRSTRTTRSTRTRSTRTRPDAGRPRRQRPRRQRPRRQRSRRQRPRRRREGPPYPIRLSLRYPSRPIRGAVAPGRRPPPGLPRRQRPRRRLLRRLARGTRGPPPARRPRVSRSPMGTALTLLSRSRRRRPLRLGSRQRPARQSLSMQSLTQ